MVNRTILAGRLKTDPTIRYTHDEKPVANFSLIVKRENEEDIIDCLAFNGLAKVVGEYLKKGKLVAIEGRLRIRKWKNKLGFEKSAPEVIVENMQMLDSRYPKNT